MTSDLGRYIFVAVAMVVFLATAQNAAGLNWRSAGPDAVISIR